MAEGKTASIAILHHLRWISALAVGYSHVRQNLLVDYADLQHPGILDKLIFALANYGHAGVIVFFVLSGFLVGNKAIALFNSAAFATEWPHFLADRFSRIFVVLLPTLLLDFLLLLLLVAIAPNAPFMTAGHWGWALQHPIDGDFSLCRWLNAMLLWNDLNASSLTLDSPLWSLPYEWFYYMAVLGLALVLRRQFGPWPLLFIAYAAGLFFWTLFGDIDILRLGLVWLLGAGANIVFEKRMLKPAILQWLGVGLVLGVLFYSRTRHVDDLVLGAAVAFMIAHGNWAAWRGGVRWGKSLAGFSYSFYLVHFPFTILVLGLLYRFDHLRHRLPLDAKGIGIFLGTLLGAILFARLFAFLIEDRTPWVREKLLRPAAAKTPNALKLPV